MSYPLSFIPSPFRLNKKKNPLLKMEKRTGVTRPVIRDWGRRRVKIWDRDASGGFGLRIATRRRVRMRIKIRLSK
jgi:hypothetical protein